MNVWKLDAWGNSVIGLVRPGNEDAFAMRPERGVFVVADGLGAHPQGQRASRMSVDLICAALEDGRRQSPASETWGDCLSRSVRSAHDSLCLASKRLLEEPPYLPMGSTVVVLAIPPGERRAYWTHAGDSRLYRLRANQLELLTVDDTRCGRPYRGRNPVPLDLPHINELDQALGTQGMLEMHLAESDVRRDDTYLLCTDGVSGMLDPEAISSLLSGEGGAALAGGGLIEAAMESGGRDNATVIVVRVAAD